MLTLIVCLEDRLGMMFNHRRLSKDVVVREKMQSLVGENPLYVTEYTAKQFDSLEGLVLLGEGESFADKDGFAFIEDPTLIPSEASIEKIIVYRWNRRYPADAFFPIDLSAWTLGASEEFAGFSHETITEEVYTR